MTFVIMLIWCTLRLTGLVSCLKRFHRNHLEPLYLKIWAKIFVSYIIAKIYLLKFNNRNTRKRREVCSKLTIKTSEQCWRLSGVFIVSFGNISHLFLLFLVLTLDRYMLAGISENRDFREDNRVWCCFRRSGVLRIYDGAFWGK